MKEQPLVSVIIPVYNVERYLAQCLDSVSHQTYQNLEIICVNDGSRDGSLDILRRYADEDARIQVIDKANGGVSRARNDALDCARGEYIMFVDSDDWVEPDACENAVNARPAAAQARPDRQAVGRHRLLPAGADRLSRPAARLARALQARHPGGTA